MVNNFLFMMTYIMWITMVWNWDNYLLIFGVSIFLSIFWWIIFMNKQKNMWSMPLGYFFLEGVSSVLLMFGVMKDINILSMMGLFMKMGVFPFHSILLELSKGMSYEQLGIFLTLHKMYPLMLMCNLLQPSWWLMILFMFFMSMIFLIFLVFMPFQIMTLMGIYSSLLLMIWMINGGSWVFFYMMMSNFIFWQVSMSYDRDIYMYSQISKLWMYMVWGVPPTMIWLFKCYLLNMFSYNMLLFMLLFLSLMVGSTMIFRFDWKISLKIFQSMMFFFNSLKLFSYYYIMLIFIMMM